MALTLISSTARHITITKASGATEYSVNDENTGRKIAHVSVIRGFAHITGTKRTATEGLKAVVALSDSTLIAVQRAFAEGLRNGRDDRENGL